jgi:hypothetical protein
LERLGRSLDGIEWLNGDSEWRDEGVVTLARMLAAFPFAGARALGLALDRPERRCGGGTGCCRPGEW